MYDRFSRYKFDKVKEKSDDLKDKIIDITSIAKNIFSKLERFNDAKSLIAVVDCQIYKKEIIKKITNECLKNDIKNLIEIDAWKWEQYNNFNFVLFKYIINKIIFDDTKNVNKNLWNKLISLLYTLNIVKNSTVNQKVMSIMNVLELDDPIRMIRKELINQLEVSKFDSSIIIIIDNLQYCQNETITSMIRFLTTIFKNSRYFKIIFTFDQKTLEKLDFPENWVNDIFDDVYDLNKDETFKK